jgi:hypothetical protein
MISGDILSRGTKAGSTTSIFETEYGQHGMKTRLKWRTGPLRPEKVCWQFYRIHTVSTLSQCTSLNPWKVGLFAWQIRLGWVECRAKTAGGTHWQYTGSQLKDGSRLFRHNPLRRLLNSLYSPDIFLSDCDRFGKVKTALIGPEIPDEIDILEAVREFWMVFQVLNCNASFEVGSNVLKRSLMRDVIICPSKHSHRPCFHYRPTPWWLGNHLLDGLYHQIGHIWHQGITCTDDWLYSEMTLLLSTVSDSSSSALGCSKGPGCWKPEASCAVLSYVHLK